MRRSHTRYLLICLAALTASVALTLAAVPLYRLFCQKMGIPLPTILAAPSDRVSVAAHAVSDRFVTVRFQAQSGAGVPIQLSPVTYTMKIRLGEPALTAYHAQNNSLRPINGVAVHMLYATGGPANVDLNSFVDLQQCFCFEMQRYPAKENVTLPLSFTISPRLPEGVHTITFNYMLYEALPNDPRIKR